MKDLDLDRPGVPGRVDRLPEPAQLDAALAGQAAAEQYPGRQRGDPVGDLEAGDPPARPGPLDLRPHLVVPPQVIGVDDHADRTGREPLGDVQRLPEGGDHAPVGGVHRVQRLDPELHAGPDRIRHEGFDRRRDVFPGGVDVSAARRQAAADEYQYRRAERGRLLDRAAVALQPPVAGEEPAAAQRGDPQTRLVYQIDAALQAERGHLLAPQADVRDPGGDAAAHQLVQRLVLGGRDVQREPLQIAHCGTPATVKYARARAAARSASGSRPASSASLRSPAQCAGDLPACSPPTIVKWSWYPASQARNTMPV